jgi:hypothetical protein
MSQEQREALDDMLRAAPLDLGGDVHEQRQIFEEMIAATPVPADVETKSGKLGDVPVVAMNIEGVEDTGNVILYLHGGAYAIGSAASSVGLASNLGRHAGTYMSGYTDAIVIARGVLPAGALFLRKPFTASQLAAKAREALTHTPV